MKTLKITEAAYNKLLDKAREWGYTRGISEHFIFALINSQESLQKCFWDLIDKKTTVEQWRKDLHLDKNKKGE